MAGKIRKCAVDFTEYKYCPTCNHKAGDYDTWKVMYCCENCRDIDAVLNKLAFGHINDEYARHELDKLDLSNKDNMREDLLNLVNRIYDNTKTVAQIEQPIVPTKADDKEIGSLTQKKVEMPKWNKKNKNIVNKD